MRPFYLNGKTDHSTHYLSIYVMPQDFAKRTRRLDRSNKADASTGKVKKASARKSNTRKSPAIKKKAPLWLWLIAFLCVVGFAIFLSQLDNRTTSANERNPDIEAETANNEEQETASRVRFEFYEILKEHEVKVDARVLEKTPEKSNIIYWLQAASFKNAIDAEQMRAKLILLSLDASVEKTLNKQQQAWHRVMIGPFKSRSRLAKARSILASNEINSILIKRKDEP